MNNDIAFSPSGGVVTVFEDVSERSEAGLDDSEIIGMLFDRDENGLAAVKNKYGGYCSAIARNILENAQDTEECVNDTYMRVWETIPPEKPRALSAFLAKITRNIAIDRYRREHMQKRGGDETALIFEELEECVSDGSSVEASAERHEMIAAVNRFLGRLPAKSRVMFVSRYCYCESIRSIALRFGTSENSVSGCLNRTRAKLRDFMKKEGYEL